MNAGAHVLYEQLMMVYTSPPAHSHTQGTVGRTRSFESAGLSEKHGACAACSCAAILLANAAAAKAHRKSMKSEKKSVLATRFAKHPPG